MSGRWEIITAPRQIMPPLAVAARGYDDAFVAD
jgi:hypothetical protein